MATIHPDAILTPHFRDFLPPWVARQPWYLGDGVPRLVPVGSFRFEDPAGEVGIETHLVTDGSALYQVPMTYRGAPVLESGQAPALITTAEHSVLGRRWIYDGEKDPVWASELLRLVRTGGASAPGNRGAAQASGRLLVPAGMATDPVAIGLKRVVAAGDPPREPGMVGMVLGTWHPGGPASTAATGCLATIHRAVQPTTG